MTEKETLKLSRLFVWGFDGTRAPASLRIVFKKFPPAGVCLFKRNLKTFRQIRVLTRELQSLSTDPLLIAIDEEGGRVTRLPRPFVPLPPAAVLGRFYRIKRKPKALFEVGRRLARQLLLLGINCDFAPVLDLNSNPGNPVIGDRAFSEDPKTAAGAALAFASGLQRGGVIPCGKHFPGHGDTKTDSHVTLPRVSKGRAGLERMEIYPFRAAVRDKIPMLMTAHVVYRALDPRNPATLSAKILTTLLRRRMGFQGVVISDDLRMKAISRRHDPAEAAILAIKAGCDLILICEGGERGGEVIVKVARRAASDRLLAARINESYRRVSRLKKQTLKWGLDTPIFQTIPKQSKDLRK